MRSVPGRYVFSIFRRFRCFSLRRLLPPPQCLGLYRKHEISRRVHSVEWNTPCNRTYGDCGCDDCVAPNGSIADIRARYTALHNYEDWLGSAAGPPKAFWGVPQAFGGSEYWSRAPHADEEAAMVVLKLNHGAKGIVAWTWPTTDELAVVTGKLARMLERPDVTALVLGVSQPTALQTTVAVEKIDAALWTAKNATLVSVVAVTTAGTGAVSVTLPAGVQATRLGEVLWGSGDGWTVQGGALKKSSLGGLEVAVFYLV